jgi:NitT/TauT family transport system substrate-binding protein
MNQVRSVSHPLSWMKRRKFIQYGSMLIATGVMAACTSNRQTAENVASPSAQQASGKQLDKITFGTNWYAEAEHGGYYQAVATGIYKEHGLDVTIKMGGPQVNGTQLLMGGAVDFMMGLNSLDALKAVEENIPKMAVAAIFQKDPMSLIAHPNVGIDSLEDMRGKRMLIAPLANATFWPFLKARFGYTEEQKGVYNFNHAQFLADKNIVQEAYATAEPFAIEKEGGFKPVVFLLADHGYNPYSTTIEVKKELVQNNPDLVQRFVDASIKGWYSYMEGDPSPANELIKKDNPKMTDEQIAYSIAKMKEYEIVMTGDALKLGIGAMTDERWKQIFDDAVALKMFKPTTNYKEAYTLQFVNKGADVYRKG